MAANTPQKVYSDGTTARLVVYRVFGITTSDTISAGAEFGNVTATEFFPTTGSWQGTVLLPVISANTTITLPAGLSKDDGYLVLIGAGVQQ